MRYTQVVTSFSIDNAIAAALFKKTYNVSIEITNFTKPIHESIVVGIPYSTELNLTGCMIFVNYFCREFSAKLPPGNIRVCDAEYYSMTEMIADILEMDVPDTILNLMKNIETLQIDDKTALAILLELIMERNTIEEIISSVIKSEWNEVHKIFGSIYQKHANVLIDAKRKTHEIKIVKRGVGYIIYNVSNELESLSSKIATIYALKDLETVFALGCIENSKVKEGFFVSRKKVNNIFRNIERLGAAVSCKKFRGFFRIEWLIRKDEIIRCMRKV